MLALPEAHVEQYSSHVGLLLRPFEPMLCRCMVTDRILEMQKGLRAAGIGKGSGPKPRHRISDITDFQKKEFWK